jgi:hypothetical protein
MERTGDAPASIKSLSFGFDSCAPPLANLDRQASLE